jgi:hypothetical protein
MNKLFGAALLALVSAPFADTWTWNSSVTKVSTYNNSPWVCITAKDFAGMACFDASASGGKEKLASVLSAKSNASDVEFSTETPSTGILWYTKDQYRLLWHFTIK